MTLRFHHILFAGALLLLTGCHASRPSSAKSAKQGTRYEVPASTKSLRGDEQKLVNEAITWLGTPYRFGGKEKSGTDCSGMTMQVYRRALGIDIPRNSREQQSFCTKIPVKKLVAGDLLFFCTGSDKNRVSHVGLYVGDGKFIHASTSKGVIVSALSENYYQRTFHSSGYVKRKSRKNHKQQPVMEIEQSTPVELLPSPEIERQLQLDAAIEAATDSIFSGFFD